MKHNKYSKYSNIQEFNFRLDLELKCETKLFRNFRKIYCLKKIIKHTPAAGLKPARVHRKLSIKPSSCDLEPSIETVRDGKNTTLSTPATATGGSL